MTTQAALPKRLFILLRLESDLKYIEYERLGLSCFDALRAEVKQELARLGVAR